MKKGKGYEPRKNPLDKYHGVVKFDVATGAQVKAEGVGARVPEGLRGKSLSRRRARIPRSWPSRRRCPRAPAMDLFQKEFPNRTFDVGIAEQHGVTFAAGLATEGFKPFATIYSTFLQRAYDQVVHDVAIQRLPVRFAMDSRRPRRRRRADARGRLSISPIWAACRISC